MVHANRNGLQGDGPALAVGSADRPDAAVAGHDLLWDGLAPAVTQALSEPLDDRLVSRRRGRGGRTLPYIEGHVAIDEANRVFGFGGWGFEVVEHVTMRRIETVDPRTGEVRVTQAYTAPVRVTVAGAPPRTDIGFHAVADESADGHEAAMKGAVTDGMKRALRSFGGRFGNALYADRQTAVQSPGPERAHGRAQGHDGSGLDRVDGRVETLRRRLIELGVEQGFDGAQVRAAVRKQTGRDLDDLTAAELAPLVRAAAAKLRQRRRAQVAPRQAGARHGAEQGVVATGAAPSRPRDDGRGR